MADEAWLECHQPGVTEWKIATQRGARAPAPGFNPAYARRGVALRATHHGLETDMDNNNMRGPNIKKRPKCKNCEGKGLLKKGDRVVKCQRCKGTGVR